MKRRNQMIVVSLDAVGSRDLEYMKTLPNFPKYFSSAALLPKVKSVYPSLTYPAHTSIVTGLCPARHGIVNNVKLQPQRSSPDWFWQREAVRATTLYDQAEKNNISTAALLWPVTGKSSVTFNLPEVWANRWWQSQILVSLLNGNPGYEWQLQKRFGRLRDGVKQPQLDNFVQESMLYTLRTYEPGLMLVHLTDVDTNRHRYGVNSKMAEAALIRHDQRIGRLLETMEELGIKDSTNLVVLGDHYQKDASRILYPNYLLRKTGYLNISRGRIGEKGNGREFIKGWQALARDCDGSCYVYIKKKEMEAQVLRLFKRAMESGKSGILRIYQREEAAALGADPECAFMLEAEEGCYFQNGWQHYSRRLTGADGGEQQATHGYFPDETGYETFFAAAGPDFRPGTYEGTYSLVDEGPTLAQVLGLTLGDTDGRVIWEILQNKKK